MRLTFAPHPVPLLQTPIDLAAGSPVLGNVGRRSGDRVGPNDAVWRPTPNSPDFPLPREMCVTISLKGLLTRFCQS